MWWRGMVWSVIGDLDFVVLGRWQGECTVQRLLQVATSNHTPERTQRRVGVTSAALSSDCGCGPAACSACGTDVATSLSTSFLPASTCAVTSPTSFSSDIVDRNAFTTLTTVEAARSSRRKQYRSIKRCCSHRAMTMRGSRSSSIRNTCDKLKLGAVRRQQNGDSNSVGRERAHLRSDIGYGCRVGEWKHCPTRREWESSSDRHVV